MNTSKQRWVAGIGSRKTPYSIIPTIDRIVKRLSELGYGIRSGGAIGADRYFETAARKYNTPLEIFVPFQRRHPDHITWHDVPYEQRRDALTLAVGIGLFTITLLVGYAFIDILRHRWF